MKLEFYIWPVGFNGQHRYAFHLSFSEGERRSDLRECSFTVGQEQWRFQKSPNHYNSVDASAKAILLAKPSVAFEVANFYTGGSLVELREVLCAAKACVDALLTPAEELRRWRVFGSPEELKAELLHMRTLMGTSAFIQLTKKFPLLNNESETKKRKVLED
jgi:hypothetical protein